MAKTATEALVFKSETTDEEAQRLKRQLNGLISRVLAEEEEEDDDDVDVTTTADQAIGILSSLKNNHRSSSSSIPDEFRCPISRHLMTDPVILSTGLTYDRTFILKWLKEGHRTCPQTQRVLSHTLLTPNHLVRELIQRWCKDHRIELPEQLTQDPNDEIDTAAADRDHLYSLLDKMSLSLSDQKSAAKQLRLLTKRLPSFRSLFTESSDSIPQLLYPLSPGRALADLDLRADLITTILNLSVHDDNKKRIGEDQLVISILIESLKSKTVETRSNAAAALFTLSSLDSNKIIIGKSGAIRPLIELLDEGHPLAMNDAASAIFNLCVLSENRGRAVRDGAVIVILKKIEDRILVDELLSILALISSHQKAIEDMEKFGAMACLFSIIKENTCERNKENCIAIIYTLCLSGRSKLWEVWEEEITDGTLSKLAQSGTSRAKRKANCLLEKLNKASLFTHSV